MLKVELWIINSLGNFDLKMQIVRTNSSHPDFQALVKELDNYLATTDGEEHDFYDQFNQIDNLEHVLVLYKNEQAVACGAMKPWQLGVEIKRMYCKPTFRRRGYSTAILSHLENWSLELGMEFCVLETGQRQEEAVAFYQALGYHKIPNYGQYEGIENSMCFKKALI